MKTDNVMHMKDLDMVLNNDKVNNKGNQFYVIKCYQCQTNSVKVYYQIMDQITIKRRVDDKAQQLRVIIHLLKLIIGHNQLAHGHDVEIMNDIAPTWMKH